jgi:hypothetical protein
MEPERARELLAGERERLESALARLADQDNGEPANEGGSGQPGVRLT